MLSHSARRQLGAIGSHNKGLTICSVSFGSKHLLELNYELTTRLNLADRLARWIVVDNTPSEEGDRLAAGDSRFDVHAGVDKPPPQKGSGSYQHGGGINRALQEVKSRFVLILDPDFFIIERDWVPRVLAYMDRNDLAFFGAPWHPRWYRKWRYFPCAHCMFVDLNRVERRELNFEPEIARQPSPYVSPLLSDLRRLRNQRQWLRVWGWALRNLRTLLEEDRRERLTIGSSRDTGIDIFSRFSERSDIRFAVLTPVYRPHEDEFVPSPDTGADPRPRPRRVLEYFRADRLSFVPKRRGYFSRRGFKQFGLPDLRARGWEEFLWLSRPFGFHIRMGDKTEGERLNSLQQIREVVGAFVSTAGQAPG